MKRKILTMITIGCIFLMAVTGCGNSSGNRTTSDRKTKSDRETRSDRTTRLDAATKDEAERPDDSEAERESKEEAEKESSTFDDVLEENTTQSDYFDSTPFQQKYWVIFTEGYRNNRVEASTFDSTLPADQLSIIWNTALEINDPSESDGCDQYYLDDNGEWIYIGNYHRLSDKAANVLASNLNVVDREGKVILYASPYSMIDWDEVDSYK